MVVLAYETLVKLIKRQESLMRKSNKNATSHACAKNRIFGCSTITNRRSPMPFLQNPKSEIRIGKLTRFVSKSKIMFFS